MQGTIRRLRYALLAVALCTASVAVAHVQEDPVGNRRFPAVRALQDPILVGEEVFQGTVTSVEDGDSLVVKIAASPESIIIQLEGVDAPELSQPGGPEAKAFLSQLVLGKTVTVRLKSNAERSARIDISGTDLSAALIRGGMAWHCPRYTDQQDLTSAEADARAAKRGLWRAPSPTPPWLHRRAGACWQQKKAGTAQERPDFSGVWTALDPSDRAGQKLTIKQDAATLTIEHLAGGSVHSTVYKLDGTTSRVLLTPHGAIDVVAKTRWMGPRLIVDERQWVVHGEEATNTRQILWVDDRGLLNLEMSSPRPIGENDATRLVLRRDAPPR